MEVYTMDGWMMDGWMDGLGKRVRWSAGVTGCIATKHSGP